MQQMINKFLLKPEIVDNEQTMSEFKETILVARTIIIVGTIFIVLSIIPKEYIITKMNKDS